MIDEKEKFTFLRTEMVEQQIKRRGIHNSAILAAMNSVPRELFVPSIYQKYAYEDMPLPIPARQSISQPYIVAFMINALALKPTDRVLEIGTGSGYAAAVLSRIVQEVYTIERIESLIDYARQSLNALAFDNVYVDAADGTLGYAKKAPFDAILVSASGPIVPPSLQEQLVIGGRLIIPVGPDQETQNLIRVTRQSEKEYIKEDLQSVRFVPLIGAEGWKDDDFDFK